MRTKLNHITKNYRKRLQLQQSRHSSQRIRRQRAQHSKFKIVAGNGGEVLTLQRRSRSTGARLAGMSNGSASGPRTSMPSTSAQSSSSISSRRRWYRPGDASSACRPAIAAPLAQERWHRTPPRSAATFRTSTSVSKPRIPRTPLTSGSARARREGGTAATSGRAGTRAR